MGSPTTASVSWDCSLFCVSDPLQSHWSRPGTFFLPLLSARHPGCTTVIPLRNCSLSEITGIGTLAPVLLMARVCTFPYDIHVFAIQLPSPGFCSVYISYSQAYCQVLFMHICTHMHVYALTSLRGNLHICRSTNFFSRDINFGKHPTFFVLVIFFHFLINHVRLHF